MTMELLDKQGVSKLLGVSPITIDRLRAGGKLPFRRIGKLIRFLPEDVEAFITHSAAGGKNRNA